MVVFASTYQGKLIKRKQQRVQRAKTKQQYHRLLRREGLLGDEASAETTRNATLEKTVSVPLDEQQHQTDTPSTDAPAQRAAASQKRSHFVKFDPLKAAHNKRVRQEQDRDEAAERAKRDREAHERRRVQALKQRNIVRSSMLQKTPRGQPVMANRINNLLGKIRQQAHDGAQ